MNGIVLHCQVSGQSLYSSEIDWVRLTGSVTGLPSSSILTDQQRRLVEVQVKQMSATVVAGLHESERVLITHYVDMAVSAYLLTRESFRQWTLDRSSCHAWEGQPNPMSGQQLRRNPSGTTSLTALVDACARWGAVHGASSDRHFIRTWPPHRPESIARTSSPRIHADTSQVRYPTPDAVSPQVMLIGQPTKVTTLRRHLRRRSIPVLYLPYPSGLEQVASELRFSSHASRDKALTEMSIRTEVELRSFLSDYFRALVNDARDVASSIIQANPTCSIVITDACHDPAVRQLCDYLPYSCYVPEGAIPRNEDSLERDFPLFDPTPGRVWFHASPYHSRIWKVHTSRLPAQSSTPPAVDTASIVGFLGDTHGSTPRSRIATKLARQIGRYRRSRSPRVLLMAAGPRRCDARASFPSYRHVIGEQQKAITVAQHLGFCVTVKIKEGSVHSLGSGKHYADSRVRIISRVPWQVLAPFFDVIVSGPSTVVQEAVSLGYRVVVLTQACPEAVPAYRESFGASIRIAENDEDLQRALLSVRDGTFKPPRSREWDARPEHIERWAREALQSLSKEATWP